MKLTADQIHAFEFAAKDDRWLTVSELCQANMSLRGADACARELVRLGIFEQAEVEVIDYTERRNIKIVDEITAKVYGRGFPAFYPRHRYRLSPTADRAPFDAALQALNAQHTWTPAAANIHAAIAEIENETWLDPILGEHCWCCQAFSPEGRCEGDGVGETPGLAMAMAWLSVHTPDMFDPALLDVDAIPFEIPAGWRFELTPPRIELAPGEIHRLNAQIKAPEDDAK